MTIYLRNQSSLFELDNIEFRYSIKEQNGTKWLHSPNPVFLLLK